MLHDSEDIDYFLFYLSQRLHLKDFNELVKQILRMLFKLFVSYYLQ